MDEDEDDVHRKGLQRWPSSHVQLKQTETAGRAPVSPSVMLPCRLLRRLGFVLYGCSCVIRLIPVSLIAAMLLCVFILQHHRNQRIREPLWWRVALAVYTLVFGREAEARENRR
uniref:Uncharacterized protein n=1 Tax=Cyprinus carpio TaxID=7962 RepID=A0A8C2QB53_CYPCA